MTIKLGINLKTEIDDFITKNEDNPFLAIRKILKIFSTNIISLSIISTKIFPKNEYIKEIHNKIYLSMQNGNDNLIFNKCYPVFSKQNIRGNIYAQNESFFHSLKFNKGSEVFNLCLLVKDKLPSLKQKEKEKIWDILYVLCYCTEYMGIFEEDELDMCNIYI